jgi:hypothetical protein
VNQNSAEFSRQSENEIVRRDRGVIEHKREVHLKGWLEFSL